MVTFIVFGLFTFLAFELVASSARWLCLIGLGLLGYVFPLYFLAAAFIAAGFFYYFKTH